MSNQDVTLLDAGEEGAVSLVLDSNDRGGEAWWLCADAIQMTPDMAMTMAANLIEWAKARKAEG